MFGKKNLSPFPKLNDKSNTPSIKLASLAGWVVNLGLLAFPAWFWSSVILKVSLGTDYFFDVLFEKIGQTFVGNVFLVFGVIFIPGLIIAYNGVGYMQSRRASGLVLVLVGIMFLVMGFYAVVRRG